MATARLASAASRFPSVSQPLWISKIGCTLPVAQALVAPQRSRLSFFFFFFFFFFGVFVDLVCNRRHAFLSCDLECGVCFTYPTSSQSASQPACVVGFFKRNAGHTPFCRADAVEARRLSKRSSLVAKTFLLPTVSPEGDLDSFLTELEVCVHCASNADVDGWEWGFGDQPRPPPSDTTPRRQPNESLSVSVVQERVSLSPQFYADAPVVVDFAATPDISADSARMRVRVGSYQTLAHTHTHTHTHTRAHTRLIGC